MRVLALIMAGGASPSLSVLTAGRAAAATPFAGKYRIIDFTLSNCVNSGIYDVGVLSQHQPRSLHEHIGVGKPWDLDRLQGGVRVLHPFPTPDGGGWQRGTADAIRYHLDVIEERPVDYVMVLAGDHVYKMDYRPLLDLHMQRGADVTLAVHSVPPHEAYRYGMVTVDGEGRVTNFEEKPRRTSSALASMGVYAFRKEYLVDLLYRDQSVDFGSEMLPRIVSEANVSAYTFNGYWADVGTVQAYYESNIALLAETPALDLYDPEWVVRTRSFERPAAQLGASARIERSLLCDGCRVDGHVSGSVIGTGVVVGAGAIIRDSVIMPDSVIEPGVVLDNCVVDKQVVIGRDCKVGEGPIGTPNVAQPQLLNTGLTVIGKAARISSGHTIGRNVVVSARSFVDQDLASGETF
ncbi:glucose-1-phosphate adenylyltransferase family protein [Herpetosiphon llansteffanensis]|uniref:glucose-1-phosphate adenylyltransferase family protein n=1 Tax=Herpetosiphon llansteffanensis TaxID=2094568 RepID=UPI000D7BEC67|nr:glucose-1-phosphate adenylyltransferase family protein [Herpetosiphon llansteffanensis]